MPSAAAIESTQDSTVSGVVVVRPNVVCSQTWPLSVNQTSARCRPIAATTTRSRAIAAYFSRILRNGGEKTYTLVNTDEVRSGLAYRRYVWVL